MSDDFILSSFTVDGATVTVAHAPHDTLLEVLRERLDRIGTKQGCDEGDCGACTVQLDGEPILSCLTLAVQAEGREVRTVEGLFDGPRLHPLIDALDRRAAIQCGFCTPGIAMTAERLLRDRTAPLTRDDVARALAGNLCRCTGYVKILDAIVEVSRGGPDEDDG